MNKKPSADDSLEELIILPAQPKKLPFLDQAALMVARLKVVSELSLNREKFHLNWETSFINDCFKLEGHNRCYWNHLFPHVMQ